MGNKDSDQNSSVVNKMTKSCENEISSLTRIKDFQSEITAQYISNLKSHRDREVPKDFLGFAKNQSVGPGAGKNLNPNEIVYNGENRLNLTIGTSPDFSKVNEDTNQIGPTFQENFLQTFDVSDNDATSLEIFQGVLVCKENGKRKKICVTATKLSTAAVIFESYVNRINDRNNSNTDRNSDLDNDLYFIDKVKRINFD